MTPRPEPPSGEMAALIERLRGLVALDLGLIAMPLQHEMQQIADRLAALLAGPQSEETTCACGHPRSEHGASAGNTLGPRACWHRAGFGYCDCGEFDPASSGVRVSAPEGEKDTRGDGDQPRRIHGQDLPQDGNELPVSDSQGERK